MDALQRLTALKLAFTKELSDKEALDKQKTKQESEVRRLKDEGLHKAVMKELLGKASEKAREDGKKVLAETSTNAMQMIMEDNYTVDMEMKIRSGVPHVNLLVLQEDADGMMTETDPANDEGGGTADIVSLATFMSLGMLVGENNQAPHFLDEPTKFVSDGNLENVAKFMKDMVTYSGKQTFLVTHKKVVAEAGDRIFFVEKDKDTRASKVTDITGK